MRENPSLHAICLTVAWATSFAMKPLNESHPLWAKYFASSEWLRERVCASLELPSDTPWEELYRRVGCLVEEQYPSREEFLTAYAFGEEHFLNDPEVPAKFEEFEMIKYQIVGRA